MSLVSETDYSSAGGKTYCSNFGETYMFGI